MGIFRIFDMFVVFKLVLGFKTYSKLFLELLPSFWAPGKPGFVLPGSFRGLVCSKIRPRLLNRLLVYSAGRAIVSRDAPTAQICSPTAQNTQKPTPTKETTKGGGRRPPPLWVLFFLYLFFLTLIPGTWVVRPSRRLLGSN